MVTQSVTDTQGLESVVPDSNIYFPTATDTTMNSIDLLGDLRYVDWGNNFWSDWLFPIGMVAEEPASPYYPDSTPEIVGIQVSLRQRRIMHWLKSGNQKPLLKKPSRKSYLFQILLLQCINGLLERRRMLRPYSLFPDSVRLIEHLKLHFSICQQ